MRLTEEMKREIRGCESSRFELYASLHDEDIPELVEVLMTNRTIQYLDLSSNKIEQAGAIKLCELKHLVHLNLSCNNINNAAVQALLLNKNLISLNCSNNSLLDDNLGKYILNKPTHHTSLNFDRTEMSSEVRDKIRMMCKKNRESLDNPPLLKNEDECKEKDSASDETSSNKQYSNSSNTLNIEPDTSEQFSKKIHSGGFFAFFKCFSGYSSCKIENTQSSHTPISSLK